MIRRALATIVVAACAVALVVIVACQSGGRGARHAQRVVLVSLDGVGADLVWQWIADGDLGDRDGLTAIAEHGLAVRRLRMVDPTLTAVNHVSLITGRRPAQTGVVSNTFRVPGTPITEVSTGWDAPIQAPTLVQAARHRGLRVGVLLWPGVDGNGDRRRGDFGLQWPLEPLVGSEILELDPGEAAPGRSLPSEDGVAALEWSLELSSSLAVPETLGWSLAVLDGTPDGMPRYDTVAVRVADSDAWHLAREYEWFSLDSQMWVAGDGRVHPYGAWCKLLRVDRRRGTVRLYRGAVHRLMAYPDEFARRLEAEVGFWPGLPDDDLLEPWWLDVARGIDLDTYLEQVERLDRYLDRVAEHAIASEPFALLLAYHPTPDGYQHSSLVVEPSQWAYSPGREVAAREGLRRVGRSVDRAVASLWRALDPRRDALVVVSDHGLVPVHDLVDVNRVLAEVGLVELARDHSGFHVAATSAMAAATSGACAHLYLNLAGREPAGVVAPGQAEETLRRAARALADLDHQGSPVVERILSRQEAAELGLEHPSCGDLVVFLAPGFGCTREIGEQAMVPSRRYGDHGYLASHDGTCGMLFARGVGVRRSRQPELAATEVAGLVAGWLGLELGTR